jgi:transglutaminase-like putative cysteine protease
VNAIVPHRPAETWARRYGDCKDQAALLVALLRTAGIPASIALLFSGTGGDLDPALPGFEQFNHAIVAVGEQSPLFIDPTDRFSPVGELPIADQGRLALVIDRSTTALVRTPSATSKDNRSAYEWEYTLREHGPTRVVETTTVSGSPAAAYRRMLASGREALLRTPHGRRLPTVRGQGAHRPGALRPIGARHAGADAARARQPQ